jgi:DnaJ family protein B protein 6
MSQRITYYEVLGISKEASLHDIKKSYKKLAIRWHPDKNPNNVKEAEEKFKQIAEAYSVLSDPRKRKTYDLYGDAGSDGEDDLSFFGHSGSFRSAHGHKFGDFTYARAEQIFKDFFKEKNGSHTKNSKTQEYHHKSSKRNGDSIFEEDDVSFLRDPFFENAFKSFDFPKPDKGYNGKGTYRSFTYTIPSKIGPNGSKSLSTSTIIRGGKKIMVAQTTYINPDGTKRTEVYERMEESGKNVHEKKYVDHHGGNLSVTY